MSLLASRTWARSTSRLDDELEVGAEGRFVPEGGLGAIGTKPRRVEVEGEGEEAKNVGRWAEGGASKERGSDLFRVELDGAASGVLIAYIDELGPIQGYAYLPAHEVTCQ